MLDFNSVCIGITLVIGGLCGSAIFKPALIAVAIGAYMIVSALA